MVLLAYQGYLTDRYHFRNTSIVIFPKRDWFAFSMLRPSAIMHATLAFVSLDRDLCRGITAGSVSTVYHRTAAIQQIRKMLEDASKDTLEALAGAVVLLTSAAVSDSSIYAGVVLIQNIPFSH